MVTIRPCHSKPRADKNALPLFIERSEAPLSRLTPENYEDIAKGHEIVHSVPGVKVPLLGRGGNRSLPSTTLFILMERPIVIGV